MIYTFAERYPDGIYRVVDFVKDADEHASKIEPIDLLEGTTICWDTDSNKYEFTANSVYDDAGQIYKSVYDYSVGEPLMKLIVRGDTDNHKKAVAEYLARVAQRKKYNDKLSEAPIETLDLANALKLIESLGLVQDDE